MFNVGPEKLVLLFVIALIVLGPSKLPDAARTLGRAFAEFRRVSGRLQDEVRDALADPKDALSAAVGDIRSELGDFRSELGDIRSELPDFGLGLGGSAMTTPVGHQSSATTSPSVSSAMPSLPPPPDDPSLN